MIEPWKVIVCDSKECVSKMFVPENMKVHDNSLTPEALEAYKIKPDKDSKELVHFTCPRCGKTESWSSLRQDIARKLYERYNYA